MQMLQVQIEAKVETKVETKVPKLIDPESIIRLALPGERVEEVRTNGGLLAVRSEGIGRDERSVRIYRLPLEEIADPLVWNGESGAELIFRAR